MLMLAAVLTASLQLNLDLSPLVQAARQTEIRGTCSIATVGYRFRGQPGQTFRYARTTYEIPEEGWIELIAERKRSQYSFAGQNLPLNVEPRDPFGFRDVRLPDGDGGMQGGSR